MHVLCILFVTFFAATVTEPAYAQAYPSKIGASTIVLVVAPQPRA